MMTVFPRLIDSCRQSVFVCQTKSDASQVCANDSRTFYVVS